MGLIEADFASQIVAGGKQGMIHSSLFPLGFSAPMSYGRGEYLNQTVFLQNLSSTKSIFNFKGVTQKNSTHINLASCDLYLWRFLDFFG